MDCSTPGRPVHHQLPEFTQTHVHWVSDAIPLSHPLSSPSPPAFNLSQHRGLFQWVSSSKYWSKYWSFSFSISPSSEYSGLISLTIDWLDLLAVQGTLKSLTNTYIWNLGRWQWRPCMQDRKKDTDVYNDFWTQRERMGWCGRMAF